MDLSCTCNDYSDPHSCTLHTPEVVTADPACSDPSNPACVCHNPNEASTCSYDPACLDVADASCICSDTDMPETCVVVVAETNRFVIGQQGLLRTKWNDTDTVNRNNFRDYLDAADSTMIWPTPEIAFHGFMKHSFEVLQGLFRVPVTGRYRFLMSCDDHCELSLNRDHAEPMSSDPSKLERLLKRDSATSFRNLYPELRNEKSTDFGVMFSKWVDLTEGQYHYFETGVTQASGHSITYPFYSDYHLSVGLEVQP